MENINELKSDTDNLPAINSLTADNQHQLYLCIKESLPKLQKIFPTTELEKAISEYERRTGIV